MSAYFYAGTDRQIVPGHWVADQAGHEGCVEIVDAHGTVVVTEWEDGSGDVWKVPNVDLTFLGVDGEDAEARANGVRVVNGLTLACDDIDALHEYAIDQVHNRGAEDLMVARILHAVRSATGAQP